MSDNSDSSGASGSPLSSWANQITAVFTALTLIAAAGIHVITFFPEAEKNLFPEHELSLLSFYNRQRLILANTGDYDYFLSHVSYEFDFQTVKDATDHYQEEILGTCQEELWDITELGEKTTPDLLTRCTFDKETDDSVETVEGYLTLEVLCVDYLLREKKRRKEEGKGAVILEDADIVDDCKDRYQQMADKYTRLVDNNPAAPSWIPGEKNRGIAAELRQGETKQFSLEDGRFSKCPHFDPDDDETRGVETVEADAARQIAREKMLALYALTYQTLPGRCIEANYYYTRDRNYEANTAQFAWFKRESIPSQAAIHYFVVESSDEGYVRNQQVIPDKLKSLPLPDVVANLKYRNSAYCHRLFDKTVWLGSRAKPEECMAKLKDG